MRRIVTGEQVARLSNPDPFALPLWRAPVYRTPAGIVILVQLARLLGRLVRLAARHPAGRGHPDAGGGHLAGPGLGHPRRPGRRGHRDAGRLAVVLAGHVRPLGGPPGPGGVAGLAVPAPLGRGA